MSVSRAFWLSEVPPTPEDHLAFALEKQRERLLDIAHVALNNLSSQELSEIIELAQSKSDEVNNG
jgi:hypothetical protein